MKVRLSYSTIKDLYEMPHTWFNKQMGLKTRELPVFAEGKAVQKVILEHISGKKIDPRIKAREDLPVGDPRHLKLPVFGVVEEKDFDPRLKIEFDVDEKYFIVGWPDALDKEIEPTLIGDVKAYNGGFGASNLRDSFQWKIYACAHPSARKVVYISAVRDLTDPNWADTIKPVGIDIEEMHRAKALAWIRGGIRMIESGEYLEDKPQERYRKCLYIGCEFCL